MANAETNRVAGQDERWVASWDAVRQAHLEAGFAATAEQRLDWLEEAMRLAQASGALAARRERPPTATPAARGRWPDAPSAPAADDAHVAWRQKAGATPGGNR